MMTISAIFLIYVAALVGVICVFRVPDDDDGEAS